MHNWRARERDPLWIIKRRTAPRWSSIVQAHNCQVNKPMAKTIAASSTHYVSAELTGRTLCFTQ
jgi:hypothetical protein